jgi:hypothetical protein
MRTTLSLDDHDNRVATSVELALGRNGMDPGADRSTCRCPGRPARPPWRARQSRAGCPSGRTCDRARADALLDRWRFRPVSRTPLAQSANLLRGADGTEIVAITGGNHRGRIRSALPQSPDVTGARWDFAFVPLAAVSRCGNRRVYSMTSSAHTSSVDGTRRPSGPAAGHAIGRVGTIRRRCPARLQMAELRAGFPAARAAL